MERYLTVTELVSEGGGESTVWLMCTKDMMGEKSKSFVAQRENYWEIGFPRCPLRERNLKLLFVKLTA